MAAMTMGIAALLAGEVVARIVKTIENLIQPLFADEKCLIRTKEPGGPTSDLRLSWEPRRAS